MVWKIVNGMCAINFDDLFILPHSSTLRGHGHKIFLPHSNLDIRDRFFSIRVIKMWNSLSADTVSASSLDSFKYHLSQDLAELLYEFTD